MKWNHSCGINQDEQKNQLSHTLNLVQLAWLAACMGVSASVSVDGALAWGVVGVDMGARIVRERT